MNIYIWGTGGIAKNYISYNEMQKHTFLGYIESKKTKEYFKNKKIYAPEEIVETKYDYILVCVVYDTMGIISKCKECKIPINKLVFVNRWDLKKNMSMKDYPFKCYEEVVKQHDEEIIEKEFPIFYHKFIKEKEIKASRYTIVSRNGFDLIEDSLLQKDDFYSRDYQIDYFRYRTFELMANEIEKNKVKGDVAEVGVFRGNFAKLINEKFSNRNLYLFDTFESFEVNEFYREVELGRAPEYYLEQFKATSEEFVLSRMAYPEKCIIRKGFFPATAKGLENSIYAFVSIDVDFEQSILEGLRYFYPRLQKGGVIFIHDYNNKYLEGVKLAVSSYESEIGEMLIKLPLADDGGTLVVLK